jgi:hypothetical protein
MRFIKDIKVKVLKYRLVFETFLSIVLIFIYIEIIQIYDRHFLCFSNGECVTAWEHSEGILIIPYKYYGLTTPNEYVVTLDSGSGSYGSTIYLAKNISSVFIVDSTRTKNYSKGKIYTRRYDGYVRTEEIKNKIKDNEFFMINTGTEFVGHGTRIDRWKNEKKETIVEPFFFFQNAYLPIYIIFSTILFFRYITEASIIKRRKQPIKSIVVLLLEIVVETLIVMIAIIGVLILFVLIMQNIYE